MARSTGLISIILGCCPPHVDMELTDWRHLLGIDISYQTLCFILLLLMYVLLHFLQICCRGLDIDWILRIKLSWRYDMSILT